MKVKTVTIGDNTLTLKTMSAGRYYDLLDEYRSTDNWTRYSQKIIFFSIKAWDFKTESGAQLPINIENFNDVIGADALKVLSEAAEEVNGLTDAEKKASSGPPAPPSAGLPPGISPAA